MSDKNYTLCSSYADINQPDRLHLFQFADFDPVAKTLEPKHFPEGTRLSDKIIKTYYSDISENQTEIREWNLTETGYVQSKPIDQVFYELFFPGELSEIDYSDPEKIRKVLTTGFQLNDYIGDEFLIVIGQSPTKYAVVYCVRSQLKRTNRGLYAFSDNVSDMLHATHFLDEYELRIGDVFDTEYLRIQSHDGNFVPTRYFYSKTILPERVDRFHLFSISEYIPQYVSTHLKKNKSVAGISNTDIRNLADTIRNILSSEKDYLDYFEITGYSKEELSKALQHYDQPISTGLLSNSELDAAIRSVLFRSESFYKQCIDAAKKDWLHSSDEEREAAEKNCSDVKEKLQRAEKDFNATSAKLTALKKESEELASSLSSKREELTKIKADIQHELSSFSDNLVHNFALSTLASSQHATALSEPANTIHTSCVPFCTEKADEPIEDHETFEEYLIDNLELVGYSTDDAVDLSQAFTFCIKNKVVLLTANSGIAIASAVAATLGRSSIHTLTIPSGFANLNSFCSELHTVLSCEENPVVYVSGIFDGYSTSIFRSLLHVLRASTQSCFIVVALDGIHPHMLPPTIWEDAIYLDDNPILQYKPFSSLKMHNCGIQFESETDANRVSKKLNSLNPFRDKLGIRSAILLSMLMVEMDTDICKNAFLLHQLFAFAGSAEKADSIGEILSGLSIPEKEKRLIRKYI